MSSDSARPALHLPARYLAIVQDILRRYLPHAEVWAYGSRVNGDHYDASDLDLVVRQPDDLTRRQPDLDEVAAAFSDSDLPILVQIVDWASIPDAFREEIEARYVVMRHADSAPAAATDPQSVAPTLQRGSQKKAQAWRYCMLGDVLELKRGYDLPKSKRRAGSVPVVSSSGLSGWHDMAKARAPGVVTGRYGTLGEVHYITDDYWPLNTTLYVRDFKGNDAQFIYYFLQSLDFQAANDKSSVPGLNRNDLHRYEVAVPPPFEQRAIAEVLGTLDDKIEQNRRTAQALERLARAIFRAWFVDFEPVKAKAAGATAFPSMSQPVFDVLPARFVDSDIGPVPEGWEIGAVSNLAVLSKEHVRPQEFTEELFKHFSIPAFDAGRNPVVERGAAIKSSKFLVFDGCVLLSKLNPRISRVWLPPTMERERQIASTEFLVLLPRNGFDRHYLYCQFQQPAFRDDLAQSASGTSNSHQRVRPNDLLVKPVVMPPAIARDGFQDIASPFFALLASNHTESRKLAELRDYLLPKLLSGELRVKDAATTVEGLL